MSGRIKRKFLPEEDDLETRLFRAGIPVRREMLPFVEGGVRPLAPTFDLRTAGIRSRPETLPESIDLPRSPRAIRDIRNRRQPEIQAIVNESATESLLDDGTESVATTEPITEEERQQRSSDETFRESLAQQVFRDIIQDPIFSRVHPRATGFSGAETPEDSAIKRQEANRIFHSIVDAPVFRRTNPRATFKSFTGDTLQAEELEDDPEKTISKSKMGLKFKPKPSAKPVVKIKAKFVPPIRRRIKRVARRKDRPAEELQEVSEEDLPDEEVPSVKDRKSRADKGLKREAKRQSAIIEEFIEPDPELFIPEEDPRF